MNCIIRSMKGLNRIWCSQIAPEKDFNIFSVCLPTLHSQKLLPLYFQLSTGLRERGQKNLTGAFFVGCISFLSEFDLGRFAWRQTERDSDLFCCSIFLIWFVQIWLPISNTPFILSLTHIIIVPESSQTFFSFSFVLPTSKTKTLSFSV